jgi:hypothetical protein
MILILVDGHFAMKQKNVTQSSYSLSIDHDVFLKDAQATEYLEF